MAVYGGTTIFLSDVTNVRNASNVSAANSSDVHFNLTTVYAGTTTRKNVFYDPLNKIDII